MRDLPRATIILPTLSCEAGWSQCAGAVIWIFTAHPQAVMLEMFDGQASDLKTADQLRAINHIGLGGSFVRIAHDQPDAESAITKAIEDAGARGVKRKGPAPS